MACRRCSSAIPSLTWRALPGPWPGVSAGRASRRGNWAPPKSWMRRPTSSRSCSDRRDADPLAMMPRTPVQELPPFPEAPESYAVSVAHRESKRGQEIRLFHSYCGYSLFNNSLPFFITTEKFFKLKSSTIGLPVNVLRTKVSLFAFSHSLKKS